MTKVFPPAGQDLDDRVGTRASAAPVRQSRGGEVASSRAPVGNLRPVQGDSRSPGVGRSPAAVELVAPADNPIHRVSAFGRRIDWGLRLSFAFDRGPLGPASWIRGPLHDPLERSDLQEGRGRAGGNVPPRVLTTCDGSTSGGGCIQKTHSGRRERVRRPVKMGVGALGGPPWREECSGGGWCGWSAEDARCRRSIKAGGTATGSQTSHDADTLRALWPRDPRASGGQPASPSRNVELVAQADEPSRHSTCREGAGTPRRPWHPEVAQPGASSGPRQASCRPCSQLSYLVGQSKGASTEAWACFALPNSC